eukprot:COSAG01_NODE_34711_length_543_cov_0.957207_1_plen_70_part_10
MLGESEHKVQKLWANVEYLSAGFEELGFDIGHSETPIIPVRGCVGLWVRGGGGGGTNTRFLVRGGGGGGR